MTWPFIDDCEPERSPVNWQHLKAREHKRAWHRQYRLEHGLEPDPRLGAKG